MNDNSQEYLAALNAQLDEEERLASEPEAIVEEPQQGFGSDAVDAFQKGAYQGVAAVGEISEQFTGVGEDVRDWAQEGADAQDETMSDVGRESMGKQIFADDGDGGVVLGEGAGDYRTWILGLTNVAGQYVDMALGGAGLAKGAVQITGKAVFKSTVKAAGKKGATREQAELLGKQALEKFASRANVGSFTILGGSMAQGQAVIETRDTAMDMTDEELDQSEFFSNAFYSLYDENPTNDPRVIAEYRLQAKKDIAEEAAEAVAFDPQLLASNTLTELIGGRFLDKLLRGVGTGSRVSNAAKGFAQEGVTETAQGGMEKYSINKAVQENVDQDQELMDGVAAGALNEGVMGGMMGGAMGGILPGKAEGAQVNTENPQAQSGEGLEQSAVVEDAQFENMDLGNEPVLALTAGEQQAPANDADTIYAGEGDAWTAPRLTDQQEDVIAVPAVDDSQIKKVGNKNNGMEGEPTVVGHTDTPKQETKDIFSRYEAAKAQELEARANGVDFEPVDIESSTGLELEPKQDGIDYVAPESAANNLGDKVTDAIRKERMPEGLDNDARILRAPFRNELTLAKSHIDTLRKNKAVVPASDSLMTALGKIGGLNIKDMVSEGVDHADMTSVNKANFESTFTKNGLSLDAAAESLSQHGYFKDGNIKQQLLDKVNESLRGQEHYSNQVDYNAIQSQVRFKAVAGDVKTMGYKGFTKAMDKAMQGHKLGQREARVVKAVMDTLSSERQEYLEQTVRPMRDRVQAIRKMANDGVDLFNSPAYKVELDRRNDPLSQAQDTDAMAEVIAEAFESGLSQDVIERAVEKADGDMVFTGLLIDEAMAGNLAPLNSTTTLDEFFGVENDTNQEDTGRTQSRDEALSGSSGQINGPEAASVSGDSEQAGSETEADGDFLTSYTEEDLAKEEQQRLDAEKQAQADTKAIEDKAKADTEAKDFSLSGSDTPADIAASRGQEDLLSQSEPEAKQDGPTDAQKEAGNYKKKHIRMHGLEISIENQAGSVRSGTDENGDTWENEIHYDYGDIKSTIGADGDAIDVFIGKNLTGTKVFVVNQTHPNGAFDEHKVMFGFNTQAAAESGYLKNYDDDWSNFDDVVETTVDDFKAWLKGGDTKKPFAGIQKEKQAPQKPRKNYGWSRTELAKNYTAEELGQWDAELEQDPDNKYEIDERPSSEVIYKPDALKKMDALGWAIINRLKMDKQPKEVAPVEQKKKTKPLSKVVAKAGKEPEGGFTDADKVPESISPADFVKDANAKDLNAGPYPLGYHNAVIRHAREGTLSLADFKAGFKTLIENEAEIKKRLNKYKKANLMGMAGRHYFHGEPKKAEALDDVWERLVESYHLHKEMPDRGPYDPFDTEEVAKWKADQDKRRIEIAETMTADDLKEWASKYSDSKKKKAEAEKQHEKALAEPETIEEFRTFIKKKGTRGLSADQMANWDSLIKEDILADVAKRLEKETIIDAVEGDVSYETVNTKHTKNGHDLYVVRLTGERQSKDKFYELENKARSIEGARRVYSSYARNGAIPGFQFKSEENRAQFLKVIDGESVNVGQKNKKRYEHKKDKRVARLLEMADDVEAKAEEVLNQDRQTNTARRAGMAANVEERARDQINFARQMREIASAVEAGRAEGLANVGTQAQLGELNNIFNRLKFEAQRKKSDLIEKDNMSRPYWKKGVSLNDMVSFAKFSDPEMSVDQLSRIINDLENTKGYMQAAKSIQSRIKGMDIKDRVVLTGHNWEKIVEKVKAFARSKNNTSYQAEWLREMFLTKDRFDKMGITNLNMLREALRELQSLDQSEKAEADPLVELERSLIGKFKDNDWFNTPEAAAEYVVDLAEVESSHKVLEPSAGFGHLADKIVDAGVAKKNIDTVEIGSDLRKGLELKGYKPGSGDFLEYDSGDYDRIIMNPPFSKDQDIAHVQHAYELLKPGGKLVAIVSSMAGDRVNKKNKAFREWLDNLGATEELLEQGSFKGAVNSTGVNTKVLVIDKPDIDNETLASLADPGQLEKIKQTLLALSQEDKKNPGIDRDFLLKHVEKVTDWVDGTQKELGEKIKVVATWKDLPIKLKVSLAQKGYLGGVRGVYSDEGMYLIADRIQDQQMAVETALHEMLGHHGVMKYLGEDLDSTIDAIFKGLGRRAFKNLATEYKLDLATQDGKRVAVLEYIAHSSETGKRQGLVKRFIAAIKAALRKMFPSSRMFAWSDTDVLVLIENSRPKGPKGPDGGKKSTDDILARLEDGPVTSDQFTDLDDNQKSFLNKIGRPTIQQAAIHKIKELMDGWRLKVRQGLVDRFAALVDLDKSVHGENVIKENTTQSSWARARLSSAASGVISAMMDGGRVYLDPDQGVVDVKENTNGLVHTLNKLGSAAEVERFMGWIAANRSSKLAAEGRENLFNGDEIAAGMRLHEGTLEDGRDRESLYGEVFNEFQTYRDDVLAIAEKAGVITPEARDMWANEFYVPFYRVMENMDDIKGPTGTGGISRQQAIVKLKGGKEELNDLLQNTLMNFHHLIDASLKNIAAQQAIKNGEQAGIAQRVIESRKSDQSTFVLQDGQKVWYDISDEMVFNAITSLSSTGMNSAAMKVMRDFKRVFTNFTTSSPQFMVANLIRDSLHAVAVTKLGGNIPKNAFGGMKTYMDDYQKARLNATGGAFHFGHAFGEDASAIKWGIDKQLNRIELRDPKKVWGLVTKAWDKWQGVGNVLENSNRASAFKQNESKGKMFAALEARDLMDFSAHGAWPAIRILIDVVPFLNARLQGLDKMWREGVKPGAKVVREMLGIKDADITDKQAAKRFTAVVGSLAMASIALYLHNQDDDEYQKLEDWQKDTYWYFRVGDNAFFLPKPFEVGAIATMAERMTEQVTDDKATGKLFAERLGHMLGDTFSFNPVPQMFQPMLDVYSNKDAFTGRDIESMSQQRLSPHMRTRANTTNLAKGVSALLEGSVGSVFGDESSLVLSPVQIDHMIGGYLGWLGSSVSAGTDVLVKKAMGETSPEKEWYEYQPARRFYRNLDLPGYTKTQTQFYDTLRELNQTYADIQEYRKLGMKDEAKELYQASKGKLGRRKALAKVQRQLGKINRRIKLIAASDNSSEWKRRELDKLKLIKNRYMEKISAYVE